MKLKIFSEEEPQGLEVDWPAVPRRGDIVSFNYRGGTTNQGVSEVRWHADANGALTEVEVHLTYGEVK